MNAATHSMQRWRLAKNATVTALLSLCPLATSLLIVEGSHPIVASAADDFNMAVTTNGIRLGNYISGPPLAADSLTNRVVRLEFWGVNCPPCLASMPKLEQLHKQLSPLGLVVIGAHAQGGPDPVVLKTAADLGVTFTILSDASVAEGGDLGGIPHCMLFNHLGKCIYRGSPFAVEQVAHAAVAASPASVLEGHSLEKLVAFNDLLRNEQAFGTALKKAQSLMVSKDEATAEEAAFVVQKLQARGQRMIDKALGQKNDEPLESVGLMQRAASMYKGSDIGLEAAKVLREWKKDTVFVKAFQEAGTLGRLQAMRDAIAQGIKSGSFPADDSGSAIIPPQLKRQVADLVRSIQKKSPDSKSAVAALALAKDLGIDVE